MIKPDKETKEKLLYLGLLGILLILTLFLHNKNIEPFKTFSLSFNDQIFNTQEKKPSQDIVFVAVDEPSVNEYGRWPWDRAKLAKGVEKLEHADVVLMDMIFSEPTSDEKDMILGESLASLNASICGFFLRQTATQTISQDVKDILNDSALDLLQSQVTEHTKPKFMHSKYAEVNILPIVESCSLSGSFTTVPDSDGRLRDYPIAMYFDDSLYPSLAIQGLRVKFDKPITRVDERHLELNSQVIGLNEQSLVKLNFYKHEDYNIVSFLDVVEGNNGITPEYFKNKIVILGITEVGAGDIVNTPIGLIPGPLLHYTFLSNFLENHLVKEPPHITQILIVTMILLPFILLLFIKKILYRAIANITVYVVLYLVVRYLFISQILFIDLFYPLFSLLLSFITIEGVAFNLQEKKEKFMHSAFSSYLSEDLLSELIKNPDSLALGGESRELSILFSDIRGFTSISEAMTPVSLITLLNRYFSPMTNIVLQNGGMLDKYIGDALMAFFNAPVNVKKHADASCYTALEMIDKLALLNTELELENINPIKIGIGINTDQVVVGNMGSDRRFNYTIIGDGVNLASRVEGISKYYGVDIIITEFTVAALVDSFIYRELEHVVVKGKVDSVLLYELMPDTQSSKHIVEVYNRALKEYKNANLTEARELFESIALDSNDGPSKYFLQRLDSNLAYSVNNMTTK